MRIAKHTYGKFNTTGRSSLLIFGICQAPKSKRIKNISLHNSGNQNYNSRHPGPQEGRFAIVTMRGLECGGRFGVRRFLTPDENAKAYGEVVWSWRRDAGAKLAGSVPPATVVKKPAHRGELEVSRKAIARGRPGCFG